MFEFGTGHSEFKLTHITGAEPVWVLEALASNLRGEVSKFDHAVTEEIASNTMDFDSLFGILKYHAEVTE